MSKAKWRTSTTTSMNGAATMTCHRLESAEGVDVAVWQLDEAGIADMSAAVNVYDDPIIKPGADVDGLKLEAAAACRRLAARLLEAADSIAPGVTDPGCGTAERTVDHTGVCDSAATATPGRKALPPALMASITQKMITPDLRLAREVGDLPRVVVFGAADFAAAARQVFLDSSRWSDPAIAAERVHQITTPPAPKGEGRAGWPMGDVVICEAHDSKQALQWLAAAVERALPDATVAATLPASVLADGQATLRAWIACRCSFDNVYVDGDLAVVTGRRLQQQDAPRPRTVYFTGSLAAGLPWADAGEMRPPLTPMQTDWTLADAPKTTTEREWCPDCGPETGTNPECDMCGESANKAK